MRDSRSVAPGHDPGKEYRASHGIPIVPAMDGFRALAIAGIVVLHLIATAGMPVDSEARTVIYGILPSCVEALFILSGFVVFLPTVVRGEFGSVRGYAIRRAARLVPAYWLAFAAVGLLLVAYPPAEAGVPGFDDIFAGMFFLTTPLQLFDPELMLGLGRNGVLWTLSVEIAFYLLLPLVAMPFLRHPLIGLAVAGTITFVWSWAINHLPLLASYLGTSIDKPRIDTLSLAMGEQIPAFAIHFALGMAGAIVFVAVQRGTLRIPARGVLLLQLGSLALLGFGAYLFGGYAIENLPVRGDAFAARERFWLTLLIATALATFMVATALSPHRRQLPFVLSPLRALGDISYGIYLIHIPMMLFVGFVLTDLGVFEDLGRWASFILIAMPLTVLYGWASARFLEQPVRRWAQRFGRRSADPPTESLRPPVQDPA
jgi:peptidoglycan/LPS O-acetylase OafA/YrhL